MWTLENVKTDLHAFLGTIMIPIVLNVKSKFSRKMTTTTRTGTKLHNGRSRFQPVYAIEESVVIAIENFAREDNLSSVVTPTLSKEMIEQPNCLTRWLT